MYNLNLRVTILFQETNKKIKDLVIKDTKSRGNRNAYQYCKSNLLTSTAWIIYYMIYAAYNLDLPVLKKQIEYAIWVTERSIRSSHIQL